MRTLKFNILFVLSLAISYQAKASEPHKRINFAQGELAHTTRAFVSLYRHSSHKTMLSAIPKHADNTMNAFSIRGLSSATKATHKPGLLQQLIRSNLRLSFRISGNFNLMISYI